MLFHIKCHVVSGTNVSIDIISKQQKGAAKLLQSLYALILRCQSAQGIQLFYESGSKTGILLGTEKDA